MPSQRSQTVVAPRSIITSHDGGRVLEEQVVGDGRGGRGRRAPAAGRGWPGSRCRGGCRPRGPGRRGRRRSAGAARRERGRRRARGPGSPGCGVRRDRRRRGTPAARRRTTLPLSSAYRPGRLLVAEQPGDLCGVPGRPGVERGRGVRLVGGDERREVARVLAGHQPLAPVEAGVPEVPVVRPRLGIRRLAVGVPLGASPSARRGRASAPSPATRRAAPAGRRTPGTAPTAPARSRRPSRPSR